MGAGRNIALGLAASWLVGWAYHGPLGTGERFISGIEAQARSVVEASEIETVEVRMSRAPLGRLAVLSGEADEFQRNGQGSLPGLNQRVAAVPGVAGVQWAGEPGPRALPLLAEVLLLASGAYAIGLGLAWLLWGRKRDDFY